MPQVSLPLRKMLPPVLLVLPVLLLLPELVPLLLLLLPELVLPVLLLLPLLPLPLLLVEPEVLAGTNPLYCDKQNRFKGSSVSGLPFLMVLLSNFLLKNLYKLSKQAILRI